MITVEEAKKIVVENIFAIQNKTKIKVNDSLGYTLAEDICASINLPSFNQSNVDGYAVNGLPSEKTHWNIIGEIKAGDNPVYKLKAGEAARIFTGALVPEGSDVIVMQEKIIREGNKIYLQEGETIQKGEHIRQEGSEIMKDELALKQGVVLNPVSISFLNGLGLTEINVFNKPRIVLIVTGNELQPAGTELEKGKIFESNSAALQSAIDLMDLKVSKIYFTKDDKKSLNKIFIDTLRDADLIIISGGISVGDYDFVKDVLKENNTETLFYKVAQKPGKPLFFGKNKNTFIFGLPGNPVSAIVCFYEYVYPALRKMLGRENIFLYSVQLPIIKGVTKKNGLAHFLKAKIKNNMVEPLEGQQSYVMKSFAEADALIYLQAEKENCTKGENVEVHLLSCY